VLLFSVAAYAVVAVAMVVHLGTSPIYPGFREWVRSAVGQALGLLLVATYPEGRPALGIMVVLANVLVLASADQVYRGLRRFGGAPARVTRDEAAVYALFAAALLYFLVVEYSVPGRVAANAAAMAYIGAKTAAEAWRQARTSGQGTARFVAVAASSTVAVYLARGAAALAAAADVASPVRARSGLQTALLLLLVMHGVAVFLGLLMRVSQRAQADLQEALARVKRLEGIIPICMHCFRVRTDQDSWDRLEKYVGEHTEAELSHGICPDCLEKHYPAFGGGGTPPPGGPR
jgi:hypothetical protein